VTAESALSLVSKLGPQQHQRKVRWEQVHLEPPSPRRFNPEVTPELEGVVLKCLEKEPARRYSSTMELLGALEYNIALPEHFQPVMMNSEPADILSVPPTPAQEKAPARVAALTKTHRHRNAALVG